MPARTLGQNRIQMLRSITTDGFDETVFVIPMQAGCRTAEHRSRMTGLHRRANCMIIDTHVLNCLGIINAESVLAEILAITSKLSHTRNDFVRQCGHESCKPRDHGCCLCVFLICREYR